MSALLPTVGLLSMGGAWLHLLLLLLPLPSLDIVPAAAAQSTAGINGCVRRPTAATLTPFWILSLLVSNIGAQSLISTVQCLNFAVHPTVLHH